MQEIPEAFRLYGKLAYNASQKFLPSNFKPRNIKPLIVKNMDVLLIEVMPIQSLNVKEQLENDDIQYCLRALSIYPSCLGSETF